MTDSLELARKLDETFATERARALQSDRPDYTKQVWPAILEILDGAPTLDAVLAALVFRDRLVADEGYYHAGAFMDALVGIVCDDDVTAEDAERLSEESLREVYGDDDDAAYDDGEGGDDGV